MRKINLIVVHCTATPEGRDVTVADIDRMHRAKGWKCIGYHYVVYQTAAFIPADLSRKWAPMSMATTRTR